MKTILNPMGKVQNTIAAHRMAIGKTAYMERSRGNQLLNNGIFRKYPKGIIGKAWKKKEDRQTVGWKGRNAVFSKRNGDIGWTPYMGQRISVSTRDMSRLKRNFAPAGQSTQMIIGATGKVTIHYCRRPSSCIRVLI